MKAVKAAVAQLCTICVQNLSLGAVVDAVPAHKVF